ncbi:M48 family metalloprotease, partial [bacterium]|nr:M48 family metalloprotease [bacterium]
GRGRGRSSGGSGGNWVGLVMMIVALLLMILAPLFARMVQMSISRKREFLADATAVELTRNPEALANALDKIDHDMASVGTEISNRATQHLFFVNPLKNFSMDSGALFSTHPPIEARIRVLRSMAS